MKKELALFDLDGTIIEGDSMIAFIRYARGAGWLFLSYLVLSPILLLYRFGLYPNDKAKQLLLSFHFKGKKEKRLKGLGAIFGQEILHSMRRRGAMRRLRYHRDQGHDVVVITASLNIWVEPWLKNQGLRYICTEPEWANGVFTGKFATPNCYGPEKVRRLREILDPADYDVIHAYGDSKGDREMLALANESHFRPFLNPSAEF
ncbi:MAG: HAD family hydrolase [Bacteroidota bacterium]